MHPILLSIGQFKLYSFGTFIALGAVAAGLFMAKAAKDRRLKTNHLFDTVLYTLLLGLLGARLAYYFIYQNQFQSIGQIIYFWQGGLVALGGLSVGFLTYLYRIRTKASSLWPMLDIGALGLLVGWVFGKFGCHLSGCSVGRGAVNIFSLNGSYPIDLFSAIWALALLVTLYFIWQRNRLSDGVIFFLGIEGLFLGEMLIKTLKADFGDGAVRIEAVINLAMITAVYLIFWKFHGPRFQKSRIGSFFHNLVFRRR